MKSHRLQPWITKAIVRECFRKKLSLKRGIKIPDYKRDPTPTPFPANRSRLELGINSLLNHFKHCHAIAHIWKQVKYLYDCSNSVSCAMSCFFNPFQKRGAKNVLRQFHSLLPPWPSRHWDWQPGWKCLDRWFHRWCGLPGLSHHGEVEMWKTRTELFKEDYLMQMCLPMSFTDNSFAAYLQEQI